MARKSSDFDLIVIGSGAGGSTAAITAANLGIKTAIIEASTFGGLAVSNNDLPLGALLHTAHLYDAARRGSRFGLSSAALRYNFPAIVKYKDIVVKRGGGGGNRKFFENLGVQTIHGSAHFLSPSEVAVGNGRFAAKHFLIATGAKLKKPDIKNIDNVPYLTSASALGLVRLPRSVFIVGGGATGVELAQYFACLGSKVLIAEKSARLLPGEDEEVGALLGKVLNDRYGIKVLTKTRVVSVANGSGVRKVTILRGGEEKTVDVNELLVATGLEPNTDIGLENAGVKYSDAGIAVNSYMQTSARRVFAVGDVASAHHSTSQAMADGQLAVENMLRRSTKLQTQSFSAPRIINTYPETASVGMSEDDCLKRDLKIRKAVVPLSAVSRSNVNDCHDGFVKLVANHHGKLLGATIVAPQASTMIHELALAIRHDILASDLAEMPHAFLSWSKAIQKAAATLSDS